METKIIKVMLIDDHPVIRQGISKLIEAEGDISICAEAENPNQAIRLIESADPDVIIIDINLGGETDGLDLLNAVRKRYPAKATLMLTMFDDETYIERAIRAGAMGYILKNEAPKKIVQAIRNAYKGERSLSKELSDKIIDSVLIGSSNGTGSFVDVLTNRELEVFRLFGDGQTVRSIAKKLNLSVNTIESHRRNIKEKLKIETNNDLIKKAAQWLVAKK